MDVGGWLRSLGLQRYEAAFRENEISEKVLPSLTAEDLKDLGVNIVGHRRLLLDAIALLRTEANAKAPPADAVPSINRFANARAERREDASIPPAVTSKAVAIETGERRHVTVMFCDLVELNWNCGAA